MHPARGASVGQGKIERFSGRASPPAARLRVRAGSGSARAPGSTNLGQLLPRSAPVPRPSLTSRPSLNELSGEDKYRLRQGDYRILYEVVDRELIVTVVKVGNRRDVYR